MQRMRKLPSALLLVLVMFAGATAAPDSDADRLIAEALKPSPIETELRHLTDEIGGRVPGSPAMQRAVADAIVAILRQPYV